MTKFSNIISQYNRLNNKIVSRKKLINLLQKAKNLNIEHIIFKLENVLSNNDNSFKIIIKNKLKTAKKSYGLNGSAQVAYLSNSVIKKLPQKIINYIVKNFDNIYGSPYSSSFYSKAGQSWDHTPKGQIRISDHWNFWSRDYNDFNSVEKQHAVTNKPVKNNSHWTVAKKNDKTGKYDVIMSLPQRNIFDKNKDRSFDKLADKSKNSILEKHLDNIRRIEVHKLIEKRNKKIGKSLWIKYDRSYTVRLSSRRFTTEYENDVTALLMKETASFLTVKHLSGHVERIKKSTLSNYKEFARKPK